MQNQNFSLMHLLVLILLALFGAMLGTGLTFALGAIQGVDIGTALSGLNENSSLAARNFVRTATMLNQLFTFLLPAIVWVILFKKGHKWRWLQLDKEPDLTKAWMGVLLVLVAFPLVQYTFWLNQQLPLPDWMKSMEDSSTDMIKGLLVMDSPFELIFNVFLIGVLPGIGEELLFRGILQQYFYKFFRSPHVAIWVTAILFSTIHFQFEGFIPRMILGAILGYLFYWTNNLWIPIIAHFVNNAMQVFGAYFYKEALENLESTEVEPVHWGAAVVSILLIGLIAQYFIKHKKLSTQNYP